MFTFDRVFQGAETQDDVFRDAGRPIADSALKGYNASIFAYGQTGSGKTFTMQGADGSRGLIPRMLEYCFVNLERLKLQGTTVVVHCSYLEIYNENVYDLLDFETHANMGQPGFVLPSKNVREDTRRGVFVEGAVEESLGSVQDAFALLKRGADLRHVGATNMNRESSRSHSIFTLSMEIKSPAEDASSALEITRTSRINLVDLAGSERQRLTKATGNRLNEAKHINKSLSALGNVISALVERGKGRVFHVPHRDSVLTYLLRDSLGGNTKTSIIATISPDATNFQDTLSTLQFGQRAKRIKNSVKANTSISSDVSVLQREVRRLREELGRAKQPMEGENQVDSLENSALTAAEAIEKKQQENRESLSENADFQRIEAYVLKNGGLTEAIGSTAHQILRQRIAHLEEVLLHVLKELGGSREKIRHLSSEMREHHENEQVLRDDVEAKKLLLQLLEQKLKAAELADSTWFEQNEAILTECRDTSNELSLQAQIAQLKIQNASYATMFKSRAMSDENDSFEHRLSSVQMQLEAVLDDKKGLESIVKRLDKENKKLVSELENERQREEEEKDSFDCPDVYRPLGSLSSDQDLVAALEEELKQAISRADKLEQELFLEMERKAEGDAERERIKRVLDSMRVKSSGNRRASTGNFVPATFSGQTSPNAVSRAMVKVAAEAHRSARELKNVAVDIRDDQPQMTAENLVRQRLLTQLNDARKQLKEAEKNNRRLSVQLERQATSARKAKLNLRKSLSERDTNLGNEQQRLVESESKFQMLQEQHERLMCTNKELKEAVEMANSFADYKSKQLDKVMGEMETLRRRLTAQYNPGNDFASSILRASSGSVMTKQSRDSFQTVRLSTFENDDTATHHGTPRQSSISALGFTPRSSMSDVESFNPATTLRNSFTPEQPPKNNKYQLNTTKMRENLPSTSNDDSSTRANAPNLCASPKKSVAAFFPVSESSSAAAAAAATPVAPPKTDGKQKSTSNSGKGSSSKFSSSKHHGHSRRSSGLLTPRSLRERMRASYASNENDRIHSNVKSTPESGSKKPSGLSVQHNTGSGSTSGSPFRLSQFLRFSSSR